MIKLLKLGLPLLLLGGVIVYLFSQPKPPLDIRSATTELTAKAISLYAAFEADEVAANATYSGKVIEVSGMLSQVEQGEAGGYVLSLDADNALGKITCNLNPKHIKVAPAVAIGEMVTVKGVCTGYLFDVVIDNALLVSQ